MTAGNSFYILNNSQKRRKQLFQTETNPTDLADNESAAGRESHEKQINTPAWIACDTGERPGVCHSALTKTVRRKTRSSNPCQLPVDGGQNDSVGRFV